MPAFGGDGCRLHASGTAACDHHPLPDGGRTGLAEQGFPSRLRVLNARNPVTAVHAVDAGLIASDALAHVFGPAGHQLVGELRVRDHGPGHAAHVRLARSDDLFRHARVVDATDRDRRLIDDSLDCRRERSRLGDLGAHGRNDLNGGAGLARRTRRDVEVVQPAISANRPADLEDLVGIETLGDHFVTRNAHAEDEVGTDPLADRADDLAQEPHAVGEAAAVFVRPSIEGRAQKLRDQIAVTGGNLDTVHAPALHAPGGIGEPGDGLPNVAGGHFPTRGMIALGRAGRRAVGDGPATVGAVGHFQPEVEHLADQDASVAMQRVGQALERRDDVVRRNDEVGR